MENSKNINLTKQGFESSFLEESFYNKQTRDDTHLNLLLDMAAPDNHDTILDLGTGSGYLAFPLARRYHTAKIIGLDIVEDTLRRNTIKAIGEELHNLEFISYDGTAFPFSDNSLDVIITRYALHHFPDLPYSLNEMYRVLKPGGKIIISDPTPNENDRCHFVDKFMQMKPDGHKHFYSLDEYQAMLKEAGFEYMTNEMTAIRFPRKEAEKYQTLLAETDNAILAGYHIKIAENEVWITEKVLNMVFMKR